MNRRRGSRAIFAMEGQLPRIRYRGLSGPELR